MISKPPERPRLSLLMYLIRLPFIVEAKVELSLSLRKRA